MDYFFKKYNTAKKEKELLFELAVVFYLNNKFNKSLDILAEASGLEGEPGKAVLLFLKALNYKSLRKPKEALTGLLDVLLIADDNSFMEECETNITQLLSGSDPAALYEIVEKKVHVFEASDNSTAVAIYNRLLSQINQQREIIRLHTEALRKELQLTISAATAMADENNFEEALAKIEEALLKQPDNPDLLFLQIRILVESQLDIDKATSLLTDEDYGYLHVHADNATAIQTVLELINSQPERGNSYFFAAFIGSLTSYDKTIIDEWVIKAEQLGLKNNNTYQDTGLYILKAAIAKKNSDNPTAALNYLEAGKQFYWIANYTEAAKHFKKAIEMNAALNDAFKYFADTLYILSYRSSPPFSDEAQLNEAFNAWHQSPQKAVLNADDAWHYIIIARIHESRYSFGTGNFYDDYWNALLYAERALVHTPDSVSFLTYAGRFFRLLGMEQNAALVLEKAMSLSNGGDTNLQEEMTIVQLNTGQFDKAFDWLKSMNEQNAAKDIKSPAHYRSWEGYVCFYREKDYAKAAALFDVLISEYPTDLFSLQMKMFCSFYLADKAGAIDTARKILALDNSRQYPREEFNFAWAYFIDGQVSTAINRLEVFQQNSGSGRTEAYSLAQFYLYGGLQENAEKTFTYFLQYNTNLKIFEEFKESLHRIIYHLNHDSDNTAGNPAAFKATAGEWLQRIQVAIEKMVNNPSTPVAELQSKLEELGGSPSPLCTIALTASLARVNKSLQVFSGAFHNYLELLQQPDLFSEAGIALAGITGSSGNLTPVVTRVAFEISSDLVPPDAASPDWYVIKDLVPAMKNSILNKYGVEPPAVRIRGNDGDLAAGTCIFMLDEVPLLMCTVEKGKYFVADDSSPLLNTLTGEAFGINPLTGRQSYWVDENIKKDFQQQGLTLWNGFEFIIHTLEALLCNNLELFVDDQYCQSFLQQNSVAANDDINIKSKDILQNRQQLLLFKNVLKNLVREKIPLVNRDTITSSFADAATRFTAIADIVREVRVAIKDDLPVKRMMLSCIDLPGEAAVLIEAGIDTAKGKTFLSMTPENCQNALSAIRTIVGSNPLPESMALIVKNSLIRYHVRKLVELEFPALIVLSQDEYTVPQ